MESGLVSTLASSLITLRWIPSGPAMERLAQLGHAPGELQTMLYASMACACMAYNSMVHTSVVLNCCTEVTCRHWG